MDKFKLKQREILRGRANVDIKLARMRGTAWNEAVYIAYELQPMLELIAEARRKAKINDGVYTVGLYVIPHNLKGVKLG
jgi:hypothetical protein